jgi:hypothetical protein
MDKNTGLDGFKRLMKESRTLALWAGGGAAVPFAAQLASLSPPWPEGIVVITSIAELVALIVVYQFIKANRRIMVNRTILIATLALIAFGISYLALNAGYTFRVPTTKERFVRGYVCTANAELVFKEKCPSLDMDDLASAAYEADRLWTPKSITVMRVSLVSLWLMVFTSLSVVIGSFVVYQAQLGAGGPRRRRGNSPNKKRISPADPAL